MEPAGRFLDKNPETGLWSDIGDRKAVEKTSQALRDGAAHLRKQLSEDLGDPDFLSAVFENDSGATSSTVRSDGSASSSSSNDTSKKSAKSQRTMKSKMARKGHRRVKSVPVNTQAAAEHQKEANPAEVQPEHSRSSSFGGPRAPTKRVGRSASTGFKTRPADSKSRPKHAMGEEHDSMMGADLPASSPWTIGHSRNSSASSGTLPPFFPMSPVGRGGHPRCPPHQQHIFSMFQEPAGRPPMSPMHRSWSPRDFQRETPYHWRQSIGGTTCYSEGDVDAMDVPSLDKTFDTTFSMEVSMDEELHLTPMLATHEESTNDFLPKAETVASGDSHEKLSLSSHGSLVPSSTVKDAMLDDSDMDLNYPPTLACDFGKGNALDDVVMKDSDPASDDGGMSPLPFFGEGDTSLLDNLPELLNMPIAPCGPYDMKTTK